MKHCKHCNIYTGEDSTKYCIFCGGGMEEGIKVCPHCNTELIRTAAFCSCCGRPVQDVGVSVKKEESTKE